MNKRVAIIGPVLPYRGGIAQHTTMLARALSRISNLSVFSFKRQYPAWLFPGQSDLDTDYTGHQEERTEYVMDSLNPLTWITVVKAVNREYFSAIIFPWWTVYWAFCFGFIALMLKSKQRDIVFFCHNVVDHESAWWKIRLARMALRQGNRFVVHSRKDEANLKALLGDVPVAIHPHPIYHQFPPPVGTLGRRRRIELLFYGFVRPYKGLNDLIDAMTFMKEHDVQLTIAGEFWEGKVETTLKIQQLNLENHIELRPNYHSDQETAELFTRADVVVLPYKSATGSGVVSIAYHYNKPVIVTRVGGLPDVVIEGKTGWVIEPGNIKQLTSLLQELNPTQFKIMRENIKTYKNSLSWESLANCILK